MPRKKLIRFAEIKEFENVFSEPQDLEAGWQEVFGNKNNIVLELGCGAGTYTLALAEKYPDKNFIGVDRKRDRIWRGAKKGLEIGHKNAVFISCFIENLEEFFQKDKVAEIWITFPDPHPKPSRAGHRLTSPKFLRIYEKFLKRKGGVHLKTDNLPLFQYSLGTFGDQGWKILEEKHDIHGDDTTSEELKIVTYYEGKFLKEGRKIYYLKARV